ncbi:MAG: MBL fold metallo-hydrolase [Desulfatitalea sp.]|nr:MBL fold metallo-hydrolase [Desulfatitalea sp.]
MALKEIRPGLFRITINTGLFPSNIYLIDRGVPTLIDTGPNHTVSALNEGLAQAGRCLSEIQRLFLTHIHWDHVGAAKAVAADLRGEMVCLSAARHILTDYEADLARLVQTRGIFLDRAGVPKKIVRTILADLDHYGRFGQSAMPHGVFESGQTFSLGQASLSAIATPGHTPQCVSFYAKEDGILFSGDFLMRHFSTYLTPHISEENAYLPLNAYEESLRRVQQLPIRLVLPGHGPAIQDPHGRISKIQRSMKAYRETILRIIAQEPKSQFQIHSALNGTVNHWSLSFSIADVAAHLGVLLAEKKVHRQDRNGVDFFSLG